MIPDQSEFIVREEEALKAWLKSMTVSDGDNSTRPVGVWFGMPDPEIRKQGFPFLTIDLLDVREDKTRVQVRYSELAYPHPGIPVSDNTTAVKTMFPTPVDLLFQVASYARQPRHDRRILQQMVTNRFHPRFAQAAANDDTSRRIDVVSFAKRDTVDDGKRLFRNVWTVKVASEFFYWPIDQISRVTDVIINPDGVARTAPDNLPAVVYP